MSKKKHRLEKDLYPSIARWLERRDYIVHGSAKGESFQLPFTAQDVDVLGFKWCGQRLDVWGIEVKRGKDRRAIRGALAQAAAYRVVIPRVSIATQARGKSLREIAGGLKQLGLGAISVSGTRRFGVPAREAVKSASDGPGHDRDLFDLTIRHAATLSLLRNAPPLAQKFPGAEWRSHASVWPRVRLGQPPGTARAQDWGFAMHPIYDKANPKSAVQIMLHLRRGHGSAQLSVWVERKAAVQRILKTMDVSEFASRLPRGPFTGRVERRLGRYEGTGMRPGKPVEFRRSEESVQHARRAAMAWAKRSQATPSLGITVTLWPMDGPPSKKAASRRLASALRRVERIFDYLCERLESRSAR